MVRDGALSRAELLGLCLRRHVWRIGERKGELGLEVGVSIVVFGGVICSFVPFFGDVVVVEVRNQRPKSISTDDCGLHFSPETALAPSHYHP